MAEIDMVAKVVDFIEDNLDKDLNLDHIAEVVNYSKFHLNRLFSKRVGCTIYKYIQMRRLTEAARNLVKSNKAIAEIAYEAHYNSQQAFTLAFKQVYGYTPQLYRAIKVFTLKQDKFTLDCKSTSHRHTIVSWGRKAA